MKIKFYKEKKSKNEMKISVQPKLQRKSSQTYQVEKRIERPENKEKHWINKKKSEIQKNTRIEHAKLWGIIKRPSL